MSQLKAPAKKFWWWHGDERARLQVALPDVDLETYTLESTELASNASFVKYVRKYTLKHMQSDQCFVLVEKCISKLFFIRSLEARFVDYNSALSGSQMFSHPDCYAVIETPWESIILTQFIVGKAPRMHRLAPLIAEGIRETEQLTSRHLAGESAVSRIKGWSMDFFRPWYLLRPRFSFQRYYRYLNAFTKEHPSLAKTAHELQSLKPIVARLAQNARPSERCLSHMDYLQKNIFSDAAGHLHIIDWSEVKIGRIGFDAGAYLSTLFRRSEFNHFIKTQRIFLDAYFKLLGAGEERESAINNIRYIFLLNSLWHFMRPQTLAEHAADGKIDWLKAKLAYLVLIGNVEGDEVYPPSRQRLNKFSARLKLDKLTYGFDLSDLSTRSFRYIIVNSELSVAPVRLLDDGSLQGHKHNNEASWSVVDGKLAFLDRGHRPSAIFERCTFENGKFKLEGKFVLRPDLEIFLRLEEIDA